MTTLNQLLKKFNGQSIKATAVNIKCAEDIDDIRQHLFNKFGQENVTETDQHFLTGDRRYPKPWLPRERVGVFNLLGQNYFIESTQSSAEGRLKPRRSMFPISALSVKDENTLIGTVDAKQNFYIEYHLSEDGIQ